LSAEAPHPNPLPASGERESQAAVPRRPTVSLIAAVAQNGAIGASGGLPWRLPNDLKRFKAMTLGKPLIMGRKTFDSVGRPLPGRRVIVVTRDANWTRPEIEAAPSLEAALALAADAPEIMIGGGGEIYRLALPLADRLYITEVALSPAADTRFPDIDPAQWREIGREAGTRGPMDEADFTYVDYARQGR
jgi:dihydrofolate reductase